MLIQSGAGSRSAERGRIRSNAHPTQAEIRNSQAMAQFSHELRNCLGTIRNAMRILDIEALEDVGRRQARMLVDRQLDQMGRLTDDLADASLVRTGRLRLDRIRIDLRVPLSGALEAVEFHIRKKHHRLRIANPAAPIWLLGDSSRLEQVFVNLLVNAAKYTHMGGEITVEIHSHADEVEVRISDSGIGIAPDVLPQIFEPYVQAQPDAVGRESGLGLGLPLVRSLVESHGGRIEAASAGLGRGSQFSVWLPSTT